MKVASFSTHPFEKAFYLDKNLNSNHEFVYFKETLNQQTAAMAKGFLCVCCFVHDELNATTFKKYRNHNY